MANAIAIRVLTNEGLAVSDETTSIIAPGELGYLGMLFNHAPLVTTLAPGRLSWKRPDGLRRMLLIGGGLLEVSHNRCTVLTTTVSEATPEGQPH